MKKELQIFFTAVMFYTRIPVPRFTGYSDDNLNRATRYFPFIGILVGGAGAGAYLALSAILPAHLAIMLSMVVTILITGAFHEDGFADFCDGFGGGYTKERILEIMKDSRIGTYGATGLILIFIVKLFSLVSIDTAYLPWALITGHTVSRMLPVILIYTTPYAREDLQSKTKPIGHKGTRLSLLVALITTLATLPLLPLLSVIAILPVSFFVFVLFRWYILKKLGGYTGDVLGALQQIAEVMFYLSYLFYEGNMV